MSQDNLSAHLSQIDVLTKIPTQHTTEPIVRKNQQTAFFLLQTSGSPALPQYWKKQSVYAIVYIGGVVMETQIGQITHFFNRIRVAVLSLTDNLEIGDQVHILGHTTDFIQNITSMEIEHEKVTAVGPGDDVALKVVETVRKGDAIYKIIQ